MRRCVRTLAGLLLGGLLAGCSSPAVGCDGVDGPCLGLTVAGIEPEARLRIELRDLGGGILSRLQSEPLSGNARVAVPALFQRKVDTPIMPLDTGKVRCLNVHTLTAEEPPRLGTLGVRTALDWPAASPRIEQQLVLKAPPAAVTFNMIAPPETGTASRSFAIADLDGDEKLDLVVASTGMAQITILRGAGDGTFTTQQTLPVPSVQPASIAVGDMNGDLRLDLVIGHNDVNPADIRASLQGDSGVFGAVQEVGKTNARGPTVVAIADIDQDGKNDLIASYRDAHEVWAYRSTTESMDSQVTVSASDLCPVGLVTGMRSLSPIQVIASDLDGDGLPDLTVSAQGSSEANVFTAINQRNMPWPTRFLRREYAVNQAADAEPALLAVADVDGDRSFELVVTENHTSTFGALTKIAIMQATTGVRSYEVDARETNPRAVAVADFDGDGNQDVAVVFYAKPALAILRGDGKGGFGSMFASGAEVSCGQAWMLEAADLNRDCKPDLVVACEGGSGVQVLLNTSP